MSDERFMKRAIELSNHAAFVEKSGGVFGAVIVKEGKIIGEGYNQVIKNSDPTWHAEMHAIREACKNEKTPHIEGAILYTSSEPCPMCLAACYWAHVEKIYYASTVQDALQYGNFKDLDYYSEIRKPQNERKISLRELMRKEAVVVWEKFSCMKDRVYY